MPVLLIAEQRSPSKFGVAVSQTPTRTPATPPVGFTFDESWSCRGTFQNNKQHLSHYEGKTILAGTWTELTEQDSEPAPGYVAKYLIGYDSLKKLVVDFGADNSGAQVSSSDTGWVGNGLALTSEVMHYPQVPYEQTRKVFRVVDDLRSRCSRLHGGQTVHGAEIRQFAFENGLVYRRGY